jgi:hypothetical protein
LGAGSVCGDKPRRTVTSNPTNPGLTVFQIEVARLFYSLPESMGFLLAGGAALLAHRITSRPTHDLDFFTSPSGASVSEATAAFEAAARARRWSIKRIKQSRVPLAVEFVQLDRNRHYTINPGLRVHRSDL